MTAISPAIRLRFVTSIPRKSELRCVPRNTEVSFVPMEAVGEAGGLDLARIKSLDEVLSGYTYFRNGDVLVAKITPCFENGKGALAEGLSNGIGFGTTELHVLRPSEQLLGKFLFYVTLSHRFRAVGKAEMYGAAGQKRVPESFLRNFRHPIPATSEQFAIVAFLDHWTNQIDSLIRQKERLLDALREQQRALVTECVCRGLALISELRESGVPWFGVVQRHWQQLQLRRVVVKFVDYRGKTPEKVKSGVPLVTAANIKNGRIDFSGGQDFIREEEYDDWMVRGLPERGDVLVTTEAPLGETAQIEDTRIALAQRIILLKANKAMITNEYLKYFFMSAAGSSELLSWATGSTAIGIKASKFKAIRVLVPPTIAEQTRIVDHLDSELSKMNGVACRIRDGIASLRKYRSALINAAVMSQIDVRNYKTQGAASCQ